jgi:hypothetical protein
MHMCTLINNVNVLQFSKTGEFISILLSYCARKFCFIVCMTVPYLCNWCMWKMRSLERYRFTRRIIIWQVLNLKVCGVKTKVTCFTVWTRGGLEWFEVVTEMLMEIQIFRMLHQSTWWNIPEDWFPVVHCYKFMFLNGK